MPVVLHFADTDLLDPGPDLVHVDQQPDIHAIVVIEFDFLKDRFFCQRSFR